MSHMIGGIMLTYVLLILGFVLLIKGADFFVVGSSSVAKLLKIPSVIIGLTIVAFGTSMPEASVSITAAMAGKNALALSNVVGSNLFNLLVVIGCSALIRSMPIQASVLKKDFPVSIFATILLLVMYIPTMYHGEKASMLSRIEGLILLALFIAYVASTVKDALKARKEIQEMGDFQILSAPLTILYIVGGIAAIVYGGDLVVDCASKIAASFGLSENFIGLTIVALGTSLPELVTSVVAAKKGESDLALGNVVGSNLFNILLILGSSSALHPIAVTAETVYDTLILLGSSIVVYIFAFHKKEISRKEATVILPIYIVFFIYILMR